MNYSISNEQENDSVRSKYEAPWIGFTIIKAFIVNLRNLTKNKLFICKEYTLLQKLTIKFFFANDKTYGIFK